MRGDILEFVRLLFVPDNLVIMMQLFRCPLAVKCFIIMKENAGYVIYECYQPDDGDKLIRELPFSSLIFARQWFVVGELLQHLPPEDRITPIVGMLQGVVEKGGELRVEVADTNESKLSDDPRNFSFCLHKWPGVWE